MDGQVPAILLGIAIPALMLFCGSVVLFCAEKTLWSLLQMLGAGCLIIVVLTHIGKAFDLLPWMRWGSENSMGHFLDLGGATLGLSLFPAGYLMDVLTRKSALR